jgi:hypothetical protein
MQIQNWAKKIKCSGQKHVYGKAGAKQFSPFERMVLSSIVNVHPHFRRTLICSFLEFRESDRSGAESDFLTDRRKNC